MQPENLQAIAETEEKNVKGWARALEALETSTFHGRYAIEIANLMGMAKTELDGSRKRLDAVLEQIKHPAPEWNKKPAEGVPGAA